MTYLARSNFLRSWPGIWLKDRLTRFVVALTENIYWLLKLSDLYKIHRFYDANIIFEALIQKASRLTILKRQCHEIIVSGFFIKQLLLVPIYTLRNDFEVSRIFVELFAFVIKSWGIYC
jgi:hypothetical protein